MIERPYLRIRFPHQRGHSWVTLSVPGGIERALTQSRLPEASEAEVPEMETWVPIAEHPAISAILSSQALPLGPATSDPDAGYELDQVLLLDPDQVTSLATARDRQRRLVARNAIASRVSQPARIIVAGGELDDANDPGASAWRRRVLAVQRWAAAL